MKTVIVYGSTTGNCQKAAEAIAEAIGGADLQEVSGVDFSTLDHDLIILGSSTWGVGDLQDDWEGKISELEDADFGDKKIALFGTGDQYGYSSSFVDAIGKIYNALKNKDNVVGRVDVEGFSFDSSEAVVDGKFVGLPLDYDNDEAKAEEDIASWVEKLKG